MLIHDYPIIIIKDLDADDPSEFSWTESMPGNLDIMNLACFGLFLLKPSLTKDSRLF